MTAASVPPSHHGSTTVAARFGRCCGLGGLSLEETKELPKVETQLGQELVRAQIGQDRRHLLILVHLQREDGAGSVKPYVPGPPARYRTAASPSPSPSPSKGQRGVRPRIRLHLSLVAQPPRSHAGECLALPPSSLVLASQRRVLSRKTQLDEKGEGRAAPHCIRRRARIPPYLLQWPPCRKQT